MRKIPIKRLAAAAALLYASGAMAGPIAYVAHGGGNVGAPHGGVIGEIDLATGAYKPLTEPLGSLTSLIHKDGSLYAYETQGSAFIEIDPASGAVLGSIARSGGSHPADMAFDPVSGDVYAVGADSALYRVDLATGAMTYTGSPTSNGGIRAITFDSAGTLYLHAANSPGEIHTLDPATGDTLSVIPGGVPGGALGLGYEPESGLLIASECCFGSDGGLGEKVFSVDPVTGAAVELFDYNDGRRIHDFAFADVPVAPTSANLRLALSGPRTSVRSGSLFAAYARFDNYGADAARRPVVQIGSNAPPSSLQVTPPSGWSCTSAEGVTASITCRFAGDFPRGTVLIPLKVSAPASMAGETLELYGEASSLSVDPQPANNSATLSIGVRAAILVPTVKEPTSGND